MRHSRRDAALAIATREEGRRVDTVVSAPTRTGSVLIRSVAVAALLLTLLTGTVMARGALPANQAATPATGAGDHPTADAAPADAAAYVALNLDPESDQFQTSADLSERAGLTDLVSLVIDFNDQDQDEAGALFDNVGATEIGVVIPALSADELDDVSSATTDELQDVQPTDVRLVLATTDPQSAFDYLTQQAPSLFGAEAGSSEQTDYAGVSVTSFSDGQSADSTVNLALADDLIIVAPTIEGVESSIDVVQGTTDAITTNPHFSDVTDELGDDAMLFSFSDSTALFSDPTYTDLLAELGLDPATVGQSNVYAGMQVSADASAPGFRVNTVSFPGTDGVATPAPAPSHSSDLTDRVPDSTMIYLGGNDLGRMLGPIAAVAMASTATSELVDQATSDIPVTVATPETATGSSTDDSTPVAGTDSAAMAEMVRSILTLLNGEYVVAIDAPAATSLSDPNSLFVLFASGIDGGPMVDSLLGMVSDSLSGEGNDVTVTSETIDGDTVYTATTGQGTAGLTFSYGVVDGQLLVGLGDSVQTYLTGVDASLASNDQFQQTFTALGRSPEDGAVVYLDLATLLPLVQAGSDLLAGAGSFPDAAPSCAAYDSQSEAQAAYDDDPFENADLDQDIDGQACDDYFGSAATPAPMLSDIDFSGVVAYGQVTYQGDGFTGSDGLFLVSAAD